jgi:hypothetical protein
MRLRLFLVFASSFVCIAFAACGGKVVLDSSSGTATGGAGGTAACTDYCNAVQTANCTSMIPNCSTSCLSTFSIGSCQSQLAATLECGAAVITQTGDCSSSTLSTSCQEEVNAVANCEESSGTGMGGTVGTSGVGGFGAGG